MRTLKTSLRKGRKLWGCVTVLFHSPSGVIVKSWPPSFLSFVSPMCHIPSCSFSLWPFWKLRLESAPISTCHTDFTHPPSAPLTQFFFLSAYNHTVCQSKEALLMITSCNYQKLQMMASSTLITNDRLKAWHNSHWSSAAACEKKWRHLHRLVIKAGNKMCHTCKVEEPFCTWFWSKYVCVALNFTQKQSKRASFL